MSVVIETTIGDITVDLFITERPIACMNFVKLCKLKYYNFNLFHTVERGFIAQTGDPTGAGDGGSSLWGVLEGTHKRFFEAERLPKIYHSSPGLLSLVSPGKGLVGSQFFFTLGENLVSLDGIHCVIGEVVEGHDTLRKLNEAIVDESFRPYQDIRITHTVILSDPFPDPRAFQVPSRSPSPNAERLKNGRIAADEDIDDTDGKTVAEIQEMLAEREAKARATILEIVGDLPDADMAPPENVLFVCKLNPLTTDDDLEIIFSRFGKVKNCEVIRDKKTNDSLQYAFIEFEEQKSCEAAYFKMDNVLIDDRRIHVDFSQSVAKVKWRGKGRGVEASDDRLDFNNLRENTKKRKHEANNSRFRNENRNTKQPSMSAEERLKAREERHRAQREQESSTRNNRSRSRSNKRRSESRESISEKHNMNKKPGKSKSSYHDYNNSWDDKIAKYNRGKEYNTNQRQRIEKYNERKDAESTSSDDSSYSNRNKIKRSRGITENRKNNRSSRRHSSEERSRSRDRNVKQISFSRKGSTRVESTNGNRHQERRSRSRERNSSKTYNEKIKRDVSRDRKRDQNRRSRSNERNYRDESFYRENNNNIKENSYNRDRKEASTSRNNNQKRYSSVERSRKSEKHKREFSTRRSKSPVTEKINRKPRKKVSSSSSSSSSSGSSTDSSSSSSDSDSDSSIDRKRRKKNKRPTKKSKKSKSSKSKKKYR